MKKLLIILLFVMIFSGFLGNAFIKNSNAASNSDIQLVINADQKEYDTNERISISVRLKNLTDKPIDLVNYNIQSFDLYFVDKLGVESEVDVEKTGDAYLPDSLLEGENIFLGNMTIDVSRLEISGPHSVYIKNDHIKSNVIDIVIGN